MDIKLLVLRSNDIKKLCDFYTLLGIAFEYHKHDNSPYHYSAIIGKMVLEIYPLSKSQYEADKNLRLGFDLELFDEAVEKLVANNIQFSMQPVQSDYGFMAVVLDPDGRKVELYKK